MERDVGLLPCDGSRKGVVAQRLFRVLPPVLTVFFTARFIYTMANGYYADVSDEGRAVPFLMYFYVQVSAAAGSFFLCFRPYKFEVYGGFFGVYAVLLVIDEGPVELAVLLAAMMCACLFVRGFFRSRGRLKLGLVAAAFVLLSCTRVRLGRAQVVEDVFRYVAVAVLYLFGLAVYLYWRHLVEVDTASGLVDFDAVAALTAEERTLIAGLLRRSTYSGIARERGVSTSTVKRRMLDMFKKLGIHDRAEFMAAYDGHEVVCNGERLVPPDYFAE